MALLQITMQILDNKNAGNRIRTDMGATRQVPNLVRLPFPPYPRSVQMQYIKGPLGRAGGFPSKIADPARLGAGHQRTALAI